MPSTSKNTITFIVIALTVSAVIGVKLYMDKKGGGASLSQAKVKGDEQAPLKITEFIDFQCPACANGSKYIKDMMDKHPSLIQLELKHFPLQMHKFGMLSAQYAECASQQGKFWEMHDLLLARQNNWKRLANARPAFDLMVQELRLDAGRINACLNGDSAFNAIQKNMQEGNSRKVRSTPTYFVNGKLVVGQKSLALEINKHLEE